MCVCQKPAVAVGRTVLFSGWSAGIHSVDKILDWGPGALMDWRGVKSRGATSPGLGGNGNICFGREGGNPLLHWPLPTSLFMNLLNCANVLVKAAGLCKKQEGSVLLVCPL